jgi:mediator of RNA polymerase II transcription subunit 22
MRRGAPADGVSDVTPQTDVSRPSALPSASLRRTNAAASKDQTSDEFLDGTEEEWNKKVDVEIETLVDGMTEIVNLASVCTSRGCDCKHN